VYLLKLAAYLKDFPGRTAAFGLLIPVGPDGVVILTYHPAPDGGGSASAR